MAYRRNRESISEDGYFDPHYQETTVLKGTVRQHRIGRRTFADGAVTTSLTGFKFHSSGGGDARAVHLDGMEHKPLSAIKAELIARGIRETGDRIHEVQLASGGGGVNVLLSKAPLRKDSAHNVDFDGQDD